MIQRFYTNSISHEEIGLKGKREYYVTGYISTEEIDRANEIVNKEAMKDMVEQIKSGNVKLDVEHDTFRGKNDIPIGRIIDAGIDDIGLWVKCVLNKSHNRFSETWNSIKEGYLDAFSIAYKIKDKATQIINGLNVTILKAVELLNVAITGNPINKGAKMTESFYKSLKIIIDNEDGGVKNMIEEQEVKEPTVVEQEPAVEQETVVEQEPAVEQEPVVEQEPLVEETTINPLDTIKNLETTIAQLKSDLEDLNKKMNEPQLKAVIKTAMTETETVQQPKIKSMFELIN